MNNTKLTLLLLLFFSSLPGCSDTLIETIERGDLAATRELLVAETGLDEFDSKGRNPLCIAAYLGHVDLIKLLIDNDAEVNAKSERGHTPLQFAADGGEIDAAQILLQCGAKINRKDNRGETALWHAVRSNKTKMATYLLDKGASIEPNNDGWSIIDLAVGNGNIELTSLFLDKGLDINCKDPFAGQSLLHLAVNQDRPLMVKHLLENGASTTQRNDLGQTPLEHARDPEVNSKLAEAVILEFTERSLGQSSTN